MAKEVKYKTVTLYRSAISGKIVTEAYAKKNPNTTVKETMKVPV